MLNNALSHAQIQRVAPSVFATEPHGRVTDRYEFVPTIDLVEAIEHPGFSFVQVLSPCLTFRPEQKEWKGAVQPFAGEATDDPVVAAARLQADGPMATGILYRNPGYPAYRPVSKVSARVEDYEEEFAL